jgi:citrate synthase
VKKVDQRRFDNQPIGHGALQSSAFVSGEEAARLLGVKRETLYAYASRGLVRSEPAAGKGRERRYHRDDLERLKSRHDARAGHGPVAAAALRWGEPVLESALTAIDARGPRYRGRPAIELAETVPFESVAELLWSGVLPDSPPLWPSSPIGLRLGPIASLVPEAAPPMTALSLAIPALAAADPTPLGNGLDEEIRRARVLVRRMAALAGLAGGAARVQSAIEEKSVARVLLAALGARPGTRSEQAMNRALVLLADHELNASSFTARVAASAGADLYACVSAGLATLSGPRHGGMVPRVEALLAEASRPERARAVIQDRARRGEEIPGFGHPLYPEGDPRARPLLEAAASLAPKSRALRTLIALVDAMREARRPGPTVDVGLAAITRALALPRGAGVAVFAIGRTAGWIAHAFEQRAAGFLLRPRARYTGP